jgi:AcrR family transcriptional regulator
VTTANPTPRTGPLSGRKAQANRNDQVILDAARAVFVHDPAAPVSAVAKEAGVGISALYRRYANKEVLLQTLCGNGLHEYIAIADAALTAEAEVVDEGAEAENAWRMFTRFVSGVVDADVHSLTVNLAGTFTPTPELRKLSTEAAALADRLLTRARSAGAIRQDFDLNDIAMLLEQMTAIRIGDAERTRALRRRYLALTFDALRPDAATSELPGPPPTAAELGQRWIPQA